METIAHKECYGNKFSDALQFRENGPQVGSVLLQELAGSTGMRATRSMPSLQSASCLTFNALIQVGA